MKNVNLILIIIILTVIIINTIIGNIRFYKRMKQTKERDITYAKWKSGFDEYIKEYEYHAKHKK